MKTMIILMVSGFALASCERFDKKEPDPDRVAEAHAKIDEGVRILAEEALKDALEQASAEGGAQDAYAEAKAEEARNKANAAARAAEEARKASR